MAYKQSPGRGNAPKTGNGIPSALMQIDPNKKVKDLPADVSTTRTGNVTTTTKSYGKKAIDAVKSAAGLEFTEEGMQKFAPSSTTKKVDLDLGKYKNYLDKGTLMNTGSNETTQTYKAKKNMIQNPARRKEIEDNIQKLNPGRRVKIQD
jgi:hypothetical protein